MQVRLILAFIVGIMLLLSYYYYNFTQKKVQKKEVLLAQLKRKEVFELQVKKKRIFEAQLYSKQLEQKWKSLLKQDSSEINQKLPILYKKDIKELEKKLEEKSTLKDRELQEIYNLLYQKMDDEITHWMENIALRKKSQEEQIKDNQSRCLSVVFFLVIFNLFVDSIDVAFKINTKIYSPKKYLFRKICYKI